MDGGEPAKDVRRTRKPSGIDGKLDVSSQAWNRMLDWDEQAGEILKGGRTMIKKHPRNVVEVFDVPANKKPQVPAVQVVQRTVVLLQTQFIDRVMDIPVVRQRLIPTVQNVQRTVKVAQVHYVDRIVGVPVGGNTKYQPSGHHRRRWCKSRSRIYRSSFISY